MNENMVYVNVAEFIELCRKADRYEAVCDILNSDVASYLKEDAINAVCGIKKEEK